MRKHKGSYVSRMTNEKGIKSELNEEQEEKTADPLEVCPSESFLDSDNDKNVEQEEDPEEEQEEEELESLEESEEELEEESEEELEPLEEPEEEEEEEETETLEESEEEQEDEMEKELNGESEEDPEEGHIEEQEEEPSEDSGEESNKLRTECISQSLSNYKDNGTEEQIEDPPENFEFKRSSETNADGNGYKPKFVLNNSNEKKRLLDATASESTPMQFHQSQKKCRQEESPKPGSGSSEKRRRSRWDVQEDNEIDEGGNASKRRKTRWASVDSQLKMLGPVQLPDFMKKFVESNFDPLAQKLRTELVEINNKLKNSEFRDDRPEEKRSPSPPPVYNNLGIRINTREVRLRAKLTQKRQDIISRLIQKNPVFKAPTDPQPPKLSKKLYIPVKEYPDYNFIGLIIGPRGNTQKRMEKETGARIFLRGKGSTKSQKKPDSSDNDDLHVIIEADNQTSLDTAVEMVEKLLIPIEFGMNEHKLNQLRELAKLNGTHKDENSCNVCKEQGHMHYACPRLQSTFKIAASNTMHSPDFRFGSDSGSTPKTQKENSDANLYVGYIPQTVDDNRLRELFTPFGKLTESKVVKDRTTGSSKGYGFVKFDSPADASAAVAHMNGYKIDGKMLAVRVAGQPLGPVMNQLPIYPGSVLLPPQVVQTPTAWPGPPGSTLLIPQKSEGLGFSSLSSISSGSSLNSSYQRSGQILFSSPMSLAQFPGDPDYSGGSQSRSYFVTPMVEASSRQVVTPTVEVSSRQFSSPSDLASFPGNPDYPGSKFQSYFATPSPPPESSNLKPFSWPRSQYR